MTGLALDIGGTKLAAGLISADGELLAEKRSPTPTAGVWDAAATLLRSVADGHTITGVGIASAGPVNIEAGTVSPLNIPDWRDFPIVDAVRELFPGVPVRMAMDGTCTALGEYRFGAGRGTPDMLGMIVSTGVGGGVLLGGRPVGGRTGNAGHIGHVVVPGAEDIACACGGVGCLEAVASGPSSVRWANARGWAGTTGLELSESAQAGDAIALAALRRSGTAVGVAIASASALLDLDLAVVGGGFAQSGPPMWEAMRQAAAARAGLSFTRGLRIVPAELGGRATLIGAGALTLGDQPRSGFVQA
ncbi:ROK family protein [Rhodococcus sp. MTM3W5.2]|uniref:ROK family protein n=1 Tax=Rhodococcus sp. MTM3W5.2 TaxID=1805827 RepID=UPI0009796D22|nr:ROK family protein [Rhodococcus sp. MTM3W5.2]AQA24644.1 ROK family protein [Rhodococcus sp. MTM3W5.2]